MTRPAPFTKASVKRAIAAAQECGLSVKTINADGSLVVERADVSTGEDLSHADPYVAAVQRGNNATQARKRYARS